MSSLGASFVLPEEKEVWDQWKCPTIDDELDDCPLGSPLLTVPTPGKKKAATSPF